MQAIKEEGIINLSQSLASEEAVRIEFTPALSNLIASLAFGELSQKMRARIERNCKNSLLRKEAIQSLEQNRKAPQIPFQPITS